MKIGVLKEGKIPVDRRVVLTPEQCVFIQNTHANVSIVVQKSEVRKIPDSAYEKLGIELVEDVSNCDVLLGVKEVPISDLIADKAYLFFSHTHKKQPYNRDLLRAILDKNITLVDWELICDEAGKRLISFGRYAGFVGCYNGFLAYGKKYNLYDLKPAYLCEKEAELIGQLQNVKLPNDFKLVVTGAGRVGKGALEILEALKMKRIEKADFLRKTYDEPVFTVLHTEDYYVQKTGEPYPNKQLIYDDPSGAKSVFMNYARVANMYVACHVWDNKAPYIFTRQDAKDKDWNIDIVADISCDIDTAIASTLRCSTIENPLYGYDRMNEKEVSFDQIGSIGVMAVDNLPCELPYDASNSFGDMFIQFVLEPLLGNDKTRIIERATQTKDGKLTEAFSYLQDYIK